MSLSTTREQLAAIKVGDEVIVNSHGGMSGSRTICRVTKVTAPYIFVTGYGAGEVRFNRKTGRRVGDSGSYSWTDLEVASPERLAEMREEIARQRLAAKLRDLKWRELSLPMLRVVWELVKPVEPPVAAPPIEDKTLETKTL